MRRPIHSLLIAGCLIAMTLFLIGCEEEIILEPQGEIWVYVTPNADTQYTITGIFNDDPNAEENFTMSGTSEDVTDEDAFEYFTDEWFIANDYFPISLVPYGDWEITVIEHTISDETVENDEGGEDNADATDPRTRSVTIDSTTPKTVSIDFTTSS
ncbi:MAG: hypothetical protein PQJ48_07805 [Sphaerochaetaceae bacterium]|nr:hypothetical protein [uncultured Sphaerochaeta sp.]MDC7230200.1 hypothetical protein [Sphaerochaetaceae bacterium]